MPGGSLGESLRWMADPVLGLFFGGFVIGEAAAAHGIDRWVAKQAFGLARGRVRWLVAVVLGATAFLSMWMSNIAAAALMIAALKPIVAETEDRVRRVLLVAVALGANLGGMATPIGSGPNALAIARSRARRRRLSSGCVRVGRSPSESLAVGFRDARLRRRRSGRPRSRCGPEGDEHPGQSVRGRLATRCVLTEPSTGPAPGGGARGSGRAVRYRLVPCLAPRARRLVHTPSHRGRLGVGLVLESPGLLACLSAGLAGSSAPPSLLLLACSSRPH